MAVQRRERGGKVRWVGRYRDPAGREHSRTFDTRKSAQAWVSERERDMRRGEWLDPADESTTVGQLAREWSRGATRENTIRNRESFIENLGALDDMPVRALRPSHITDWHAVLVKGRPWKGGRPLAESSAAVLSGHLAGLLTRAQEDGLINRVPRFEPPKSPKAPIVNRADLLTPAQVAAMIRAGRTHLPRSPARLWLARMITVAAGSGLRLSELCGLQVRDVDFFRREIHVRRQSSPDGKSFEPLKSDASERAVPVPQVVIDAIAEQLAEHPRGQDESVWIRDDGTLHNRNSVGRALHRMIEHHGLRKATMHDLRHYYASALIAAGVPVTGVQAALGHANAKTTLSIYAHLWPGADQLTRDAARDAMDAIAAADDVRDRCGTGDLGGTSDGQL